MNQEKCQELLRRYREHLLEESDGLFEMTHQAGLADPIDYASKENAEQVSREHLYRMTFDMEDFMTAAFNDSNPKQRSCRDKFMRWLGFIQGALWHMGDFCLDDLRSDSKPDDEPFRDAKDLKSAK